MTEETTTDTGEVAAEVTIEEAPPEGEAAEGAEPEKDDGGEPAKEATEAQEEQS